MRKTFTPATSERLWKPKEPGVTEKNIKIEWHQMNGWEMLHINPLKGFPP